MKFHENLSSGSRVVPCGVTDKQTDRHDEASNRFTPILRTRLKMEQSVLIAIYGRNIVHVPCNLPHTYKIHSSLLYWCIPLSKYTAYCNMFQLMHIAIIREYTKASYLVKNIYQCLRYRRYVHMYTCMYCVLCCSYCVFLYCFV